MNAEPRTDPTPDRTPRRAAVVYNPIKVDLDALRAAVATAEEQAGYGPSSWHETTKSDPGAEMARSAVDEGVDLIVAAGGDGTVRAVVEGLQGSECALGLLPAGTGNLLARNLDLTLDDLETAVLTAFDGADRPVDLGVAEMTHADGTREKMVFVVMAGVGLDAQMVVNSDPALKAKAGWLAYIHAISKSLKGGRRIKLRYKLDGDGFHTARVHTLLAGNCGSLPGNILLLPDASVDDGVLDIVALRPEGPLGWLQIWAKILVENAILRRTEVGRKLVEAGPDGESTKKIRALRYLRGAELQIQLRSPEPFELDGDVVGEIRGVTIRAAKHALVVRVPRDSVPESAATHTHARQGEADPESP